jgi:mRNA interferase RelE/StbE
LDYEVKLPDSVTKYLKKIKDQKLKKLLVKTIFEDIPQSPKKGNPKRGDLAGILTWSLTYQGTQYRIAYTFENKKLIVILLVGSHENFYTKLKELM